MLKEKASLIFLVNLQLFEEKLERIQRKQKQPKKAMVLKPDDEMIGILKREPIEEMKEYEGE